MALFKPVENTMVLFKQTIVLFKPVEKTIVYI